MCCGLHNLLTMTVSQSVVADKVVEIEKDIVFKSIEHYIAQSLPESPRTSAFETPRASSAEASKPRDTLRAGWKDRPAKYVSPMAKARAEKKCKEISSGKSKDWPTLSDMETSSTPSSGEDGSLHLELSNGLQTKAPSVGVKARPSTASKEDAEKVLGGSGHLPKFGEWDKHSANSGPCYTLLFQSAAELKKTGGPVRVYAQKPPSSPGVTEDLYDYKPVSAGARAKKKTQCGFLSCFSS